MMTSKLITSTLGKSLVVFGLAISLMSCGGSKAEALDINNEQAIINFMQGKWTFDNTAKAIEYRIEIVGNSMKLYGKVAGDNWKAVPDAERNFTLGTPTMDVDKYYHIRYLEFDEGNLTLGFRSITPIWVVCDKAWGEPAMPYGGGFTYLRKGWY